MQMCADDLIPEKAGMILSSAAYPAADPLSKDAWGKFLKAEVLANGFA